MRANTGHMAFTVSHSDPSLKAPISVVRGAHFYAESNLARTMLGKWAERQWSAFVTNAEHWEAESLLHRMVFQMFRHLDRHMAATTPHALKAKIDADDHSQGSYNGYLAKNSIIYMLLCFEIFSPIVQNGMVPPLPDTFLSQQWNGRAIAYELYLKVKEEGGLAWDSLCQVIDEMDDRILHKDDILSPVRQLVDKAQCLPPVIKGIPTHIYDPRFTKTRRQFYSKPKREVVAEKGGPTHLFAWSNIAENTILVRSSSPKQMSVLRSSPIQVRHIHTSDAATPLALPPLPESASPIEEDSDEEEEDSDEEKDEEEDIDAFVAWREKLVLEVQRIYASRASKDRRWLERLDGGDSKDVTGTWIGLAI